MESQILQVNDLTNSETILSYEIDSYSSYEEPFCPNKIMDDCPYNSESRWTTSSNSKNEFIIIKLAYPSIITSISFGKYKKAHKNNIKEFKIYIGDSKEEFTKIISAGLKNNGVPENFIVDYKETTPKSCNFIKIKPMASWNESTPFSIWSVKVKGIKDQKIIDYYDKMNLEKNKEMSMNRCFDFLIENKCLKGIEILKNVGLFKRKPNDFIEILYESLIIKEEYDKTINLLSNLIKQGVFDEYAFQQPYKYEWKLCHENSKIELKSNVESSNSTLMLNFDSDSFNYFTDFDVNLRQNKKIEPALENLFPFFPKFMERINSDEKIPKPRGGHQMFIDEEIDKLYMFGGYYGEKEWDMLDFWIYDMEKKIWSQILPSNNNNIIWPEPRCCHCLSYDNLDKKLYIIGGLVSSYKPEQEEVISNMKNDFYVYDFQTSKWRLISQDTSLDFGPMAMSSGQMCIDTVNKILYLFGGRTETITSLHISRLAPIIYFYDLKLEKWGTLDLKSNNDEKTYNDFINTYDNRIYGHCMLFNPNNKEILIYGGIVNSNLISDFFVISTINFSIQRIQFAGKTLPTIAFHKGAYNSKTDSLFFYSGYMQNMSTVFQVNYLFECNLNKKFFRIIYQDFNLDRFYWHKTSIIDQKAPMPRFSHQFIYHSIRNEFYVFGGNPNPPFSVLKTRLNDLWKLKIEPQNTKNLMKKMEFWVKKLKFLTLIKNNIIDDFSNIKTEFQKLKILAEELSEAIELENLIKESLIWGSKEIDEEKIEVFKKIKNMCHCENVKKRKFVLSYLDY